MSQRLPHAEMADEISKMIWSKQTWLDDFSSGSRRRPSHEIETKTRELAVLRQAAEDYQRAVKRATAGRE